MMQEWGDHLDGLHRLGEVVAMSKRKAARRVRV
jgi:hypothetical protein